MTTFLRTEAGLSNEAMFFDVDYVVYVEGGEGDKDFQTPPDEIFWNSIFASFRDTLKIKVKGQGGKSNLLDIAKKVSEAAVKNCIVCIDADYDRQIGRSIAHNNVLYTYGYSWENDVVCKDAILYAISNISTINLNDTNMNSDLRDSIRALERIGRRIGVLDIKSQLIGHPIQNKKKPGELLILKNSRPPEFCHKTILKKIAEVKADIKSKCCISLINYDFFRDYHGKTIALCIYHVAGFVSRNHGRVGGVSLQVFTNMLLRHFTHRILSMEDDACEYYKKIAIAID